jgi:GNAT superfamily N-acetyltransferase
MTPVAAPPGFNDWQGLLDLIMGSFAYMDGRIDPPSSAHRLTPATLAQRAQDEHLWIIRDGARLVGCGFFAEQPGALYLGKLAIAPGHAGRGLGRALVEAAAGVARHRGIPLLRLETRVELTGNQRAFAAMGFSDVARTAHAGYDRPTSVTMERPV